MRYKNRRVCPDCSEWEDTFVGCPMTHKAVVKKPVFLVIRKNKKTGVKFLGCPNFPKCKFSQDTLKEAKKKWMLNRKYHDLSDYADELRPY